MAGFEDLIKRAIVSQNAQADPAARQRIYASSSAALERMLGSNAALTPEAAHAQRAKLAAAIAQIESDFDVLAKPEPVAPPPVVNTPPPVAATPPAAPQSPPVSPPPGAVREPVLEQMPPVSQQTAPILQPQAPVREPYAAAQINAASKQSYSVDSNGFSAVREGQQPPLDYTGGGANRRRPYIRTLAWVIILCGLAMAAWWAWTFGPQLLQSQIDQRVANPQTPITRGAFTPDNGEGWISVFDPALDPTAIVTENRGTAELVKDTNGTIARLRSASSAAEGNILIRIPPGVVAQMRGKAATFELIVSAPADGDQQVAIYCEFDVLGSCGRKRFQVGRDPVSHIFDVLAEDVSLPSNRNAFIALNTDILGQGRSIDLAGIRMRIGG